MANLVLDVTVTGASEAKREVKAIGTAGTKVQETFNKISSSAGFTKMVKNMKLTRDAFRETRRSAAELVREVEKADGNGFVKMARNAKAMLRLEEEINDELEKQGRIQARLAKSGSSGNRQTAQMVRQLNLLKKQTKEIDKKARSERAVEKLRVRAHSRELKRIAKERLERRQAMAARKQFLSGLANSAGIGAVAGGVAGLTFAAVEGLTRAVAGLTRAWIGMGRAAAASFYEINAEMEQMKILLSTAAGSEVGGQELFGNILAFSEKAPFSINSLTDSFVKLKTAGIDPLADGTLQTLVDSVAAFGGSSEQLRLVTIAIQQMVGKGVVSMEELRRQFGEQVPTAMRAMAEGLGMSILDMFDLIGKGGLEASRGIEAMLGVLEKWHGGAAMKRMDSMKGAVIKLRNAWTKLMLDLGKSENAFGGLKGVVVSVAAAIDRFRTSPETKKYIDDLAKSMAGLFDEIKNNPKIVTDFLSGMTKSFKTAVGLASDLVGYVNKLVNMSPVEVAVKITGDLSEFGGQGGLFGTIAKGGFNNGVSALERLLGITVEDAKAEVQVFYQDLLNTSESVGREMAQAARSNRMMPVGDATTEDMEALEHAIGQLSNAEGQMAHRMTQNLQGISGELETAREKVVEAADAFNNFNDVMKNKLSGYKAEQDALFAPTLSFEEAIAAAAKLEKQASGIADGANGGWEEQVRLLEEARAILLKMKSDANAVSKAQVAGAKKAYAEYYKISRGGMVAGSDKELKRLRDEYTRLAALQKAGKADAEEENVLKAKQKGLLEDNYRELEKIYNKQKENLGNASLQAVTDVAELEATEKKIKQYGITAVATSEAIQEELAEEVKLYYEIAKAAQTARSVASSGASGTDYAPYDGRYAGGPVSANTPYIVGEKGPELFVPNNSGNIVPNNELRNGETTEINLSFNGTKVGPMFSTKQVAKDVLREFEIMQGALS